MRWRWPGRCRPGRLTDAQVEDLVRRSYQYVALYNVNNKFALKQGDVASLQYADWDSDIDFFDTTLKGFITGVAWKFGRLAR